MAIVSETGEAAGTLIAVVIPDRCDASGVCVEVCPAGAVSLAEVAMVDPALCDGCGICEVNCRQEAIVMLER